MADIILVLNAGSSSLKFSAFRTDLSASNPLARGQVEGLGSDPHFVLRGEAGQTVEEHKPEGGSSLDHEKSLGLILERCQSYLVGHQIVAVGHRVVHGGTEFTTSVRIDDTVLAALERLAPLAPLHQPHNLAGIRAVQRRAPALPQVACFDTAFHRTQPEVAQRFALPQRITDSGVRRYGFHGLSYEYIASVLPNHDARAAAGRTVVAHLGNGASLCALLAGRSIATTMGFTPLDGLVMGTRPGLLDPGVILHLITQQGMTAANVEHLLEHESGLLGVSGISSDMRRLLGSDEPPAAEAVELFVYRLGRELGSMAAALGGLDAIVFTGGIGENAAAVRDRVCRGAAWLGLELNESANNSGSLQISTSTSRVSAWVIPTNEEFMIAEHTRDVLNLNLSR